MSFSLSDITSSYDLSKDCSLSIGGETLGGVKNGSVSFSFDGGADNSTRTDGAWKSEAPGRGNCTIEVTYNKIATDACQVGIRKWALGADRLSKVAEVKWRSDGSVSTSEATGYKGNFYLTGYSETDAEDPGQAVEVQATFVSFGAVMLDNASASSNSDGTAVSSGSST